MGMSSGALDTREIFQVASQAAMANALWAFQLLAFAVPALSMAWALYSDASWSWVLVLLVQAPG